MGVLFELLEALDVILSRLATRTGARSRNGICGLDEDGKHGVGVNIAMMALDGMDDNGLFAVTTGKVGANHGMRALDFVVDSLAKIMKETSSLGDTDIDSELGSHDAAELGKFDRVLQNVIRQRGAVAKRTEGLD